MHSLDKEEFFSIGGSERPVLTLRRVIADFAVAQNGRDLAYMETRTQRHWWYPGAGDVVTDMHILPLHGMGGGREVLGLRGWGLAASCGTILMVSRSKVRDAVTGKTLPIEPYITFRCSADRKIVVGRPKRGGLEVGTASPQVLVSPHNLPLLYDISPTGRYVAYLQRRRLCVADLSGTTSCGPTNAVDFADRLSVSDLGSVIFGRWPSGGLAMWKPGQKSPIVLQTVGRDPQWLTPAAASALLSGRLSRVEATGTTGDQR